jgi:predicted dehydrogenase
MDIGCYAINAARLLFDAEPVDVRSTVRRDPEMGVDTLTSAVLTFPGGGQSSFTVGIRSEPYQRVHAVGTRGRIEVEIPFNIPPDRPTRVLVTAGGDPPAAPDTHVHEFEPLDQYTRQAEVFGQAILDGAAAPVPPSDAVATLAVIEAVLGR